MHSPSLLASIVLHGIVVAAVAWRVPIERSGMPHEDGTPAEFNALLLDSTAEGAEEVAPTAELFSLVPLQLAPATEPLPVVDLTAPPVVASHALSERPAPLVGILDTTSSTLATKSSRMASRSRRSSAGLVGSRTGGGGIGSYTPPRYARCPAPPYPSAAREAHQSGLALLRVSVEADGSVVRVAVARSSGSPALDNAALATIRTWRFVPAQLDAKPVPAVVEVPVRFVL